MDTVSLAEKKLVFRADTALFKRGDGVQRRADDFEEAGEAGWSLFRGSLASTSEKSPITTSLSHKHQDRIQVAQMK